MSFTYYLKNSIWEWILCTAIGSSLSLIVFNGFYISQQRQSDYGIVIRIIAVLSIGCILGAYNKRTVLIAIGSGVLSVLAVLLMIQKKSGVISVFRDQESNPYLYFLIIIIVALTVFMLCRTRTGTGILFVAGAFMTAAMEFLYESVSLAAMLMFLCSCGAMYIYKNYQKNVLESQTVKIAMGRSFTISVILCILIMAISAGIFYGIVKPMDPPERELKLITKYKALEIMEKVGIADTHIIDDSDELTDNINEDEKDSRNKGDKEDKSKGEKEKQKDENLKDNKNNPTNLDDSMNKLLYAIKYMASVVTPLLLIPFLLLIILAAILMKLWLRRRWLNKVKAMPLKQQIIEMYHFYIKKFRRLKIRKAPGETPFEFSDRAEMYLSNFRTEEASFSLLTEIFVKAKYGDEQVVEDDQKRYLNFHKMFYKNCRKHLGNFKYIIKFFML